ncbi:MAG: tyrosine-type recombinase/integrase [Bacteroidia bacterium]
MLPTLNLDEAILLCIKYKTELFDEGTLKNQKPIQYTLTEAMQLYIDYLNNVNVPTYEFKKRSEGHINDVKRHFKYSMQALELEGINARFLSFNSLNSDHVSIIFDYMKAKKGYMNKTINKLFSTMRLFYNHLILKHNLNLTNPFLNVVTLPVKSNIEVISKNEFEELLTKITYENGWIRIKSDEKKNYYKTWLKSYFKLALFTGRRREELIMLKFSDIIHDDNNQMMFLRSEHFKVNRMKGVNSEAVKDFILIPITSELRSLIVELGYNQYKNSTRYLLAHDDPMQRLYMVELASKAFTHFYKMLNTERELKFKCLRKTYITQLFIKYGESSRFITHHSDIEVIRRHYLDQKQLVNSVRDFKVFE